jgi:diguanylate cyclase (GGDEF)-like protein
VLRPRDFLGRFGGEEFVMVLPETDAESALTVAERLRAIVLELGIAHEGSAVAPSVTVSLGIGTIVPGPEDEPQHFLEHVDKLLYKAKQAGRNRTEFAL